MTVEIVLRRNVELGLNIKIYHATPLIIVSTYSRTVVLSVERSANAKNFLSHCNDTVGELRSVLCTTKILIHTTHYSDVIMGAMASQITSLTVVYSTVCPGADQRKHQSSASQGFVRGIRRSQRTSNAENVLFDDVIMGASMLEKVWVVRVVSGWSMTCSVCAEVLDTQTCTDWCNQPQFIVIKIYS